MDTGLLLSGHPIAPDINIVRFLYAFLRFFTNIAFVITSGSDRHINKGVTYALSAVCRT